MSVESFDPWQSGPPTESPHKGPSRVARYVVAGVLAVLVGGYVLAAFLTKHLWLGGADVPGTEVTLRASGPDGTPPTADELTDTRRVVRDRVAGLGVSDPSVVVDGSTVTVTVPGDGHEVGDVTATTGHLQVRPVIQAIAAAVQESGPPPPNSSASPAQVVEDEKKLRQGTEQSLQVLALQFQATRCNVADPLAGHDDPDLPLVTCSHDGKQVYLLDKALIHGEQIADATSGFNQQQGQYVVDLEFNRDAAEVWADFTAANVGTQTAFTLDTSVVSAPLIQEAISGGRTQITGQLDQDSARELAATLGGGTLPVTLTVETSQAVTVPGHGGSTLLRIVLGAVGPFLAVAVIAALAYLATSRRRIR